MRTLRIALALLALAAAPALAQTGSATLSCTPPTKNTDGTTLTNLAGYKAYWGTVSGTYPNSKSLPVTSNCMTIVDQLTPGSWFFAVSAISSTGQESAKSNVATKLIPGVAPNPPTVPQPVTVAGPVFALLITTNSMVVPQVGTVTAGKPCDPTQQVAFMGATYMRVDAALATPLPGQTIDAAWAVCQ